MQILILAVGKETPKDLATLQANYEQRLRPHATVKWQILSASRSKEPELIRAQESEQIGASLKPTDIVILLDERGEQLSNKQFAAKFNQLAGSQGRMVFIIGGAYGVSSAIRTRANLVWSFSKLVFPHQLMRVMLMEQLYRTFMVQQGHPYHHN